MPAPLSLKQAIFLFLFFVSCGTTKKSQNLENSHSTEQVFISNQTEGLPGKCYQKMMLNNEALWTEVLCQNEISKGLIKQIQTNLIALNYEIAREEISNTELGSTTKQAIKDFQINNNMAYGGLDWVTINKLKSQ